MVELSQLVKKFMEFVSARQTGFRMGKKLRRNEEECLTENKKLILLAALAGICLAFYTHASGESRTADMLEPPVFADMEAFEPVTVQGGMEKQPETEAEEWYGTDRKLTKKEWEIMGQVIMAEARGESFEVQYSIACTILNRADSPLFPDTLEEVIYQTEPVQFQGAWDSQGYEVTDSVWEAVWAALIRNELPEDVYYFTSEGWLPGTQPWKQLGNMWFSRQRD